MSAVLNPAPPGDGFAWADEERRGLEQFVDDVLPRGGGHYVLAEVKRDPAPHDSHTSVDALVQAFVDRSDRDDVYFAVASFRERVGPYKGRKQANAASLRSYFADIDVGEGKGFATTKDALRAVYAALQGGMPVPTYIVFSGGGGLHLYFCLTEDIGPDAWQPVAKVLHSALERLGVKPDPAVTTDTARVLRLPGSKNGKTGERARVLKRTGVIYRPEEFAAAVRGLVPEIEAPTAPRPLNAEILASVKADYSSRPRPSATKIAERCAAFAGAVKDNGANTPEPYWRATLGIVKHCADPEDHARRYSQGHADYDEAETLAKMAAWDAGPTTCSEFGKHAPEACATCEHRGEIKSPIVLGQVDEAAPAGDDAIGGADADARPTDLALSEMFVRHRGAEFKYDHTRRGWMHWARGTWTYCAREQQVEAFKWLGGRLLAEAATAVASTGGSEGAKRLMGCAMRAQSANGTQAALKLAQSAPAVAVGFEDFDRDPDLFNCTNGAIHLPTRELRPHDPALLLHRQAPVAYDQEAKCPEWIEFLRQVSCDDPEWVAYLQTSLGYALSGHVIEERAQFWLGNGANGKSVMANVVRHVFGTYAAIAPSAFLMQSRREAGGATPEFAMLPGVRLLLANEIEAGSRLSAQTLKVAVSTEHMSARALYGNPFSFKPTHKLFVRGNHRPIIADDDEGIWRRIDLVPFDLNLAPEDRDPGLEARLLAEAPGILRWMVEGFARWRREGLRQPRRVREASLAYRKDSDVLGQWIEDACDVGQGFVVGQRTAYVAFRQWCVDQGLRCPAKKSFTRSLKERGIGEARETSGAREHTYTGIRRKS